MTTELGVALDKFKISEKDAVQIATPDVPCHKVVDFFINSQFLGEKMKAKKGQLKLRSVSRTPNWKLLSYIGI